MLGKHHSEKHCRRMSKIMRNKAFWKGKHLSGEIRRKISKALKGNKNKLGKLPSEETRKKMSEAGKKRCTKEWRKKQSEEKKGKPPWNKGKINCYSEVTRQKISKALKGRPLSRETCQKMSMARHGEKSILWKGGISRMPYAFSFSRALKKTVLQRDSYECQICGAVKMLLIHHIDGNKQNSASENLITWCFSCHSKYHSRKGN